MFGRVYLVVPVLVMEDAGVMDSIRPSALLPRETRGEQLIADLAFGGLALPSAVPGIVMACSSPTATPSLSCHCARGSHGGAIAM
jgi:hypothetical protein